MKIRGRCFPEREGTPFLLKNHSLVSGTHKDSRYPRMENSISPSYEPCGRGEVEEEDIP